MDDLKEIAKLIPEGENGPVAVLCAELTLYWRGSMHDRASALLALYRRFVAAHGKRLTHFETGTMAGSKPLKKDTLETLPLWLSATKRKKDIFMLHLDTAAKKQAVSDCDFFFRADEEEDEPLGAIRISMATDALTAQPSAFVDAVIGYVGDLDFESGHAGFGLNWDPRGEEAADAQMAMARVAAQLHGIDLFDFDVTMVAMAKTQPAGLKCASWLTLLGDPLLQAMDRDADALAADVAPKCTMHRLPKGVIVQAGSTPSLLHRNRGADLSAYRAVAAPLAPYRFTDHRAIFPSLVPGDPPAEGTLRWLARFE